MGVKGLRAQLLQRAPSAFRKIKLSELRDKVIAFDASLYIYKWSLAAGGNITNSDGRRINHIQGALFNVECMRRHGIKPCYVFDGAPPPEKAATIAGRVGKTGPPPGAWKEAKELLRLLGVTTVRADGEADVYAAAMTKTGAAYAVVTDDLDALAFGARRVILDLNCAKGTATLIDLDDALAGLKFNLLQFIDMCLLMGTDYTVETVRGIGAARAYSLIEKHSNIESVLTNTGKEAPPGFTFAAARAVFSAAPPQTITEVALGQRDPSLKEWLAAAGVRGKRIDNLFT